MRFFLGGKIHPPGIEPGSTAPETVVLSIEPWVLLTSRAEKIRDFFYFAKERLGKFTQSSEMALLPSRFIESEQIGRIDFAGIELRRPLRRRFFCHGGKKVGGHAVISEPGWNIGQGK